jgi:outer membrane lipoprotein-sorting protein
MRSAMRRRAFVLGLGAAGVAMPARAQTAQPSVTTIVSRLDAVRNPGQPFRSTVTLVEYVNGKARDRNALLVYAKQDPKTNQFRNLIRYLEPPRDAGKTVLLDGHILWFYDPASKASVRISPQQRLLGQASIADVLTVNLAVDYTGALIGNEAVEDAMRQQRQCWHVNMKAANDRASYNHVEFWVEQGTYYPIKARFFSDSGRLLKILYYRNFVERLGAIRPTEAIIIDAVDTSLVTTVSFDDYRFVEIPDAWFQRDFLPRLPNR